MNSKLQPSILKSGGVPQHFCGFKLIYIYYNNYPIYKCISNDDNVSILTSEPHKRI